jgi:DNA-binding transcriptional ArsR family regulator
MLCGGELSTRTMQGKFGVEQANLSQYLAILRSRQIVANRKDGDQVFYSIRNPVLVEVLDVMRRYFQINFAEEIQMLEEVKCEASSR